MLDFLEFLTSEKLLPTADAFFVVKMFVAVTVFADFHWWLPLLRVTSDTRSAAPDVWGPQNVGSSGVALVHLMAVDCECGDVCGGVVVHCEVTLFGVAARVVMDRRGEQECERDDDDGHG